MVSSDGQHFLAGFFISFWMFVSEVLGEGESHHGQAFFHFSLRCVALDAYSIEESRRGRYSNVTWHIRSLDTVTGNAPSQDLPTDDLHLVH